MFHTRPNLILTLRDKEFGIAIFVPSTPTLRDSGRVHVPRSSGDRRQNFKHSSTTVKDLNKAVCWVFRQVSHRACRIAQQSPVETHMTKRALYKIYSKHGRSIIFQIGTSKIWSGLNFFSSGKKSIFCPSRRISRPRSIGGDPGRERLFCTA